MEAHQKIRRQKRHALQDIVSNNNSPFHIFLPFLSPFFFFFFFSYSLRFFIPSTLMCPPPNTQQIHKLFTTKFPLLLTSLFQSFLTMYTRTVSRPSSQPPTPHSQTAPSPPTCATPSSWPTPFSRFSHHHSSSLLFYALLMALSH